MAVALPAEVEARAAKEVVEAVAVALAMAAATTGTMMARRAKHRNP